MGAPLQLAAVGCSNSGILSLASIRQHSLDIRMGSSMSCSVQMDRHIATGSSDGTIRLWDTHTGEQKKTFAKGVNWINRVALSPDGKIVAGGTNDGTP